MPYEKVGDAEPVCIADEVPFEIPENWEWARLGSIVYNHGQKKPDFPFSYIDIGSIDNNNQSLNQSEIIVEPENAPSRARKIVMKGDILYSTVRPYLHNMCIVDREFTKEPIASTGFAVLCCHSEIFNKFLFYYLLSPDFDTYANDIENSKGVAYPAINDDRLYKAIISIPPAQEQIRIIELLSTVAPYVNKYYTFETNITSLNNTFPNALKKSILQQAVQGKLVPQDPSDEPASILLERIRAEKAALIKAGKLKKDKHESIIYRRDNSHYEKVDGVERCIDDEIPFEIPESWEWARLKSIGITQTGNTPSKAHSEFFGDYIPFIGPGDIQDGDIDYSNHALSKSGKEMGRVCSQNSILQVCIGGSIGKAAINNTEVAFNQQINSMSPMLCNSVFMYYIMTSPYYITMMKEQAGGTATPIINRSTWDNMLVPIAPLQEQNRIVDSIGIQFNLINQI